MSDWWAFLALYERVLVWPLAILFALLALTAKSVRNRVLYTGFLIGVFLPHIQKAIGDVYFDHLCRTQAGEFIYRTVDNVEGILQMRPRDGSKDYFDRMSVGDIPEDPWGHTNLEAQQPWILFRQYKVLEKPVLGTLSPPPALAQHWHPSMSAEVPVDAKYVRYFGYDGHDRKTLRREFVKKPSTSFGYTWSEDRGLFTKLLNIYPGTITVVDLRSQVTLAEKRGFFRVRPFSNCERKDETFAYDFVSKVLRPPRS